MEKVRPRLARLPATDSYRWRVTLSFSVPGFFLLVIVNPSSGLPSDSPELFPFLDLTAPLPILRSSSLLMLSGSRWGRLDGVMLPLLRDGVIDLLALTSSYKPIQNLPSVYLRLTTWPLSVIFMGLVQTSVMGEDPPTWRNSEVRSGAEPLVSEDLKDSHWNYSSFN